MNQVTVGMAVVVVRYAVHSFPSFPIVVVSSLPASTRHLLSDAPYMFKMLHSVRCSLTLLI